MKLVIGSVGMPCAGKSEVALVAKKMGFGIFKFRDVVEKEARKLKVDKGPLTLTYTGTFLRKKYGKDIIAKKVVQKIKKSRDAGRVFVEGIRTLDEINCLKKNFKNFYSIAVVADQKTRLERALKRKRWDDPKNVEELKKKDEMERNWGVMKALKGADFLIDNEGSIRDFYKNTGILLKKILKIANGSGEKRKKAK